MFRILVILAIILGVFFWVKDNPGSLKAKNTTDTFRGAASIFLDGALDRDIEAMKAASWENEHRTLENFLGRIDHENPTFAKYTLQIKGSGSKAGGLAQLYGEKGDMFMTVPISLQKRDGVWKIQTYSTRASSE